MTDRDDREQQLNEKLEAIENMELAMQSNRMNMLQNDELIEIHRVDIKSLQAANARLKIENSQLRTDILSLREKKVHIKGQIGRPRKDPALLAPRTKYLNAKAEERATRIKKGPPTDADQQRALYDEYSIPRYSSLISYAQNHTQEETKLYWEKDLQKFSLSTWYDHIYKNVCESKFYKRDPNTGMSSIADTTQLALELEGQVKVFQYLKSLDDAVHQQFPYIPHVYSAMVFPLPDKINHDYYGLQAGIWRIPLDQDDFARRIRTWPCVESNSQTIINDIRDV